MDNFTDNFTDHFTDHFNDSVSKLWIHWNMSGDQIVENAYKFINKSKIINKEIVNFNFSENSYSEFLALLADDITEYEMFHSMCDFLQIVSPDIKVKKCCYKANIILSEYINALNIRSDIYTKLVECYTKCKDQIDNDDLQFLGKVIKSYERNGSNLGKKKTDILLKIRQEISKLEHFIYQFICTTEKQIITLTQDEISGLPHTIVKTLKVVDNFPKKYGIPLNKNNFESCMRYLHNNDVRKKIENIFSSTPIRITESIVKLLVLRHKYSNILGHNNYSDYRNELTMAENSKNIKDFLTKLIPRFNYRFDKEISTLLKLKKSYCQRHNIQFDNTIHSWEIQYYMTRWKKEYGLNENDIREYFPVRFVVPSIINELSSIFNIKFKLIENPYAWSEDVNMYSVYKSDNQLYGYIYTDLFERINKPYQTRCYGLIPGCTFPLTLNKQQIPITAVIASFNKNSITFNDLISLFHELVHALHYIFGKTKYSLFCGTNVEDDFIETPAQTVENLCWNNDFIKRMSKHRITGKRLDDETIEGMIKIKNINTGTHFKRNILFSLYDQLIHSSVNFIKLNENMIKEDKTKEEFVSTLSNVYHQLYSQIMSTKNNKVCLSPNFILPYELFSMVINGGANYYGYIWNKIYSSDIYNDKIKNGITDQQFGQKLKSVILEYGGTSKAMHMLQTYLGREPSIDGFFELYELDSDVEYSFFFNTDSIASQTLSVDQNTGMVVKKLVDDINTANSIKFETIENEDSENEDYETRDSKTRDSENGDSETGETEYMTSSYSNRFTEIDSQSEYEDSTGGNSTNQGGYVQSKLQNQKQSYVSENTETLRRYNNIFLKQ